jgi:hypothetical protein
MIHYPGAKALDWGDNDDMFTFALGIEHFHTSSRRENRQIHHHDVASVSIVKVTLHEIKGRYFIPPALFRAVVDYSFTFPRVDNVKANFLSDFSDGYSVLLLFFHTYYWTGNEHFLSHI